ncbi:MAG: GNAT family N-acetyltransferase [Nitrososphaeraceae archaeon]
MTHLSFPKLFGKLVNLRKLSIDDATTIVSLMSHEIAKYLYEVPYPYKIDDALYFIKSSYDDFRLRKTITFAIDYKNKSQSFQLLCGTSGIKDIDYVNKKANIGYWIGKQYHGKGIATECIKLVVNYAFNELKLEEISAYVFPDNYSSIRVLEKNGFEKTKEVNEYHPISKRYKNSLVYKKNKDRISS